MQMIKFMFKQFLKEPLWFKILISSTFLISIIFSSSIFSDNAYFQSLSKLAAAIFFITYGIKLRSNRVTSVIFFTA
jgi:amino acid permease